MGGRHRAAAATRGTQRVRGRRVGGARNGAPRRLRNVGRGDERTWQRAARYRSAFAGRHPRAVTALHQSRLRDSRRCDRRFATPVSRWLAAAFSAALAVRCALAQDALRTSDVAAVGRSIAAIVDELRATGVPLAYSTGLLPPSLTVRAEAQSLEPLDLVREILAPHGLTLRLVEGLYIVVRSPQSEATTTGSVTVRIRDAVTGAMIAAPGVEAASSGLAVATLADGRLRLSG